MMERTAGRDKGYDIIRALAVIMIMIFHYTLTVSEAGVTLPFIVRAFVNGSCNIGRTGVVWFSMISGAVLLRKYRDSFDIRTFFKRRILRIYIPLWISYIAFFLILSAGNEWMFHVPAGSIISSLLGLDFYYYLIKGGWNLILVGEWYTSAIITAYLLFPLFRFLFGKARKVFTVLIAAIVVINQFFPVLTANEGTWSIVHVLFFFWCGMLFEEYGRRTGKEGVNSVKARIVSGLVLCAAVFVFGRYGIGGFGYVPTIIFGIFSFTVLYTFLTGTKAGGRISGTGIFSAYSYEIYLLHHRIFIVMVPLFITAAGGIRVLFVFIILSVIIVALSVLLGKISGLIIKKIR